MSEMNDVPSVLVSSVSFLASKTKNTVIVCTENHHSSISILHSAILVESLERQSETIQERDGHENLETNK